MATIVSDERTPRRREQASYEIEAVTKALRVLEALEGIGFEPVSLSTVAGRAHVNENFAFRALRTLELRGYAKQIDGSKWTLGPRILKLSGRYSQIALEAIAGG